MATEQEYSVTIEAPQQLCFEVITDFESYPNWNSNITSATIEASERGRALRVAFEIDARVKTIRYALDYEYEKPKALSWESVAGDVNSITGSYRFEKLSRTRTEVRCRQKIDLGFWLPGAIRRLAENTALKQSVGEFKAEVERRRAAKKTRTAKPEPAGTGNRRQS